MTDLAAPAANAAPADKRPWAQRLLRGERPYMLYIAFVVLLIVFSLSSPWFLSLDNFLNIGRQTTLVSIIAVGMTFVIITAADRSLRRRLAQPLQRADSDHHDHRRSRWGIVGDNWLVGASAGLATGAIVGARPRRLISTRLSGSNHSSSRSAGLQRRARVGAGHLQQSSPSTSPMARGLG